MTLVIIKAVFMSCLIVYVYTALYLFWATSSVGHIKRRIIYCIVWPYTIPKSYKLWKEERERKIQQERLNTFMGR
jgi:hypothetical protein